MKEALRGPAPPPPQPTVCSLSETEPVVSAPPADECLYADAATYSSSSSSFQLLLNIETGRRKLRSALGHRGYERCQAQPRPPP